MTSLNITYECVPYGAHLNPQSNVLVLDVGRQTQPGVIDHHHPEAPPECTASLLVKNPELILNHIYPDHQIQPEKLPPLKFVTHRFPDFDAIVSLFLAEQIKSYSLPLCPMKCEVLLIPSSSPIVSAKFLTFRSGRSPE